MAKVILESKTVAELRKIAKYYGIKLQAGLSKADIVAAMTKALIDMPDDDELEEMGVSAVSARKGRPPKNAEKEREAPAESASEEADDEPVQLSMMEEEPAVPAAPVSPSTRPEEKPAAAPERKPMNPHTGNATFRSAWTNPNPEGRNKDNWGYNRASGTRAPMGAEGSRAFGQRPVAPVGFGPGSAGGFGPGTQRPAEGFRRAEPQRPTGFGPAQNRTETAPQTPARSEGDMPRSLMPNQRIVNPMPEPAAPAKPFSPMQEDDPSARPELFQDVRLNEVSGVLELHPDGYGFLRNPFSYLPSQQDVYVSTAQVHRFDLRAGDIITGKARPQRDSDRFAALVYVLTVNGIVAEELGTRRDFNALTPVYPTRKLDVCSGEASKLVRMIDSLAPIGYGQRVLVRTTRGVGKQNTLRELARSIKSANPDLPVLVLLMNIRPEDVTDFRDTALCTVVGATFEQSPESLTRLVDLIQERAQRFAEAGKDCVVIVDSLSVLARLLSTNAQLQGRSTTTSFSPTGMLKAKRIFGCARSLREGGSITVIAALDEDSESRVDVAIADEFRDTANMEVCIDADLVKAESPAPLNVHRTFSGKSSLLLTPDEQQCLTLLRKATKDMSSADAAAQIMTLIDQSENNATFYQKLKDLFA